MGPDDEVYEVYVERTGGAYEVGEDGKLMRVEPEMQTPESPTPDQPAEPATDPQPAVPPAPAAPEPEPQESPAPDQPPNENPEG